MVVSHRRRQGGTFSEAGGGARSVEEVDEVEGRPVLQFTNRVQLQLECPGVRRQDGLLVSWVDVCDGEVIVACDHL